MEAALRSGLEQSLIASATTVAAALEEQGAALCEAEPCAGSTSSASARGTTIYAAPLASEPSLDGVRDDWNVGDDAALVLPAEQRIFAGVRGRFAYLYVEVRIPLALVGARLGVGVIGVDRAGGDYAVTLAATWDAATGEPGRFIHQRAELGGLLAPFGRAGGRFRVLDADGWVLADAGRVASPAEAPERESLLADLFRLALRRNDPPYPAEQPAGRIAAAPLR